MSAIRVGSYVTHSQRPAWGVGKVFGQSQQHVLVGFRALPEHERFKRMEFRFGLLEPSEVKQDPELDSWKVECDSTCHYIGAVAKPRKMKTAPLTREQAMERFLGKFNNGFTDAWYRSTHRDQRLSQHQTLTARLQPERLRALAVSDPRGAGDMILQLLDTPTRPLLSGKGELPRLAEAFADVKKLPAFLVALADLLEAERPTVKTFEAYVAALAAFTVAAKNSPVTWPIVTAIPYLAQPDRHLFVRPTSTQRAATLLGFELRFNRKPNWQTYERVLGMGNNLLEFIKPRSGEDMFDVQAFIAAIGES
jgi:hypothetical protein